MTDSFGRLTASINLEKEGKQKTNSLGEFCNLLSCHNSIHEPIHPRALVAPVQGPIVKPLHIRIQVLSWILAHLPKLS